MHRRLFSNAAIRFHENPLGLPRQKAAASNPSTNIPQESEAYRMSKRSWRWLAEREAWGRAPSPVNLAFALGMLPGRLRVGILDLDIFGPSLPVTNHGLATMSMGYLLPKGVDTAVVWRGLMVQKAGLDVLVVDMPPGTGDVPLTLGQLVNVDGRQASVIVSTPQDVALTDVKKGIAMFRKVSVPVTGLVLNQSHFVCGTCSTPHYLFGSPDRFREAARLMEVDVLGELPLVPGVSEGGDSGVPYALSGRNEAWNDVMRGVAEKVWASL
ncbi:ParA/MinD ATPase like-domain-containing protein [Armillaria novae-zelandiae]|uniref:ParA/MinD ATPase like-domain-containing protein n=1 Tax=Armillaria novae-zelandiae TaxID=153914 RepID=A0AA39UC67_9AGAR|nr:ParA/MinD ATPase like-domain-containing protein [Armillaria novae-zelandiae]